MNSNVISPAEFVAKKPIQLYQSHFEAFKNSIAEIAQGPLSVAIIVEDASGDSYTYIKGPLDRIEHLKTCLHYRIKDERRKVKPPCYLRQKLKNGLNLLSDLI